MDKESKMKVIYSNIPFDCQRIFDIENEDNKILEAMTIAKQIQKYTKKMPGYFFFVDDKGARLTETNYFINATIANTKEMRALNKEYSTLMEQNKYEKAAILASGEEILPFFDSDRNLTIN